VLYAIAGSGEAPTAEINKVLADLKAKATAEDVDFWFIIEAKDEQSKTDKAVLAWLTKNQTYFETVTSTDAAYEGASEAHQSEDPLAFMLERLLGIRPDEDGWVLALLPPEEADDDEALMALIEGANAAEVEVRQLNGAMEALSLTETEAEPEEEPEPAPAPAKKAAAAKKAAPPAKAAAPAKKAAKKAAAPAAVPEPEEEGEGVYSQEELSKLGVPELTGIARGQGIDTKGLGKRDLITAILGSTRMAEADEAVAIATAAVTNGDDDVIIIVIPRSKLAALLG